MKKAFTLVELLAVIVILAALILIASKSIANIASNAKEQAYNTEVNSIKAALKMYATDNFDSMPSDGDTIYLTLYQLKEYGYLKDVKDTNINKSFPDDTLLSIKNENQVYSYNLIDGNKVNDYETLPDLKFEGAILDICLMGSTYIEDTPSAISYEGTNITSNITKKYYSVSNTGVDTEITSINTSTPGNYKIVYTVTDSDNTASIIKNIIVTE